MAEVMFGAYLPGNSTVEFRELEIPTPGHGEVLVQTGSATICGSDIKFIYREHLGEGPSAYQNKVCSHEPAGRIIKTGPGMKRFKEGDRVAIYHISGCGVCNDCRRGYMISCTSPLRKAYGWQKDGGMAPYILADEKDCVLLPDSLSYVDGSCVACGYGTTFEAILKVGVSGLDRVLVVGLGPVGMACLHLAKAMGASKTIGVDVNKSRCDIVRRLGLADEIISASGDEAVKEIKEATGGHGCEKSFDCSGHPAGRLVAIQGARKWGSIAFVGEGSTIGFEPSRDIIHDQKTIYGSWVTNIQNMELLVEKLDEWKINPEIIVTDRLPLEDAGKGFELMANGECGKVAVTFDID